jgi:ATP-dependent RNA helicase SUPV3L1/SUV3
MNKPLGKVIANVQNLNAENGQINDSNNNNKREKPQTINFQDIIPEELKNFDFENYAWNVLVNRPNASSVKHVKNRTTEEAEMVRNERKVKKVLDKMNSRVEFKRKCPVMNFTVTWFSFSNYIVSGNFPLLFDTILDFFSYNSDGVVKETLTMSEHEKLEEFILPFFCSYARKVHPDDFALYQEGVLFCNFTNPQLYYLRKKKLKREIIYHSGPTNSGKTHQALLDLSQADSGIYLAPLRLLAQEVCVRMNTQFQKRCSLLTGQERKDVIGAKHLSCTIEMLNDREVYNVAVIDEIQMIKDPERGQAWTKALLGLQAQRIHLCGDHTAFDLVQRILKNNGDETVILKKYDRMTELQLWPEGSLKGNVANIQKRDCIIVFSRKDIFYVKNFIEVETGFKCAVIYGGLPPESRKEQAELFNDESSGYDVLVATDAVGMGLNLNIRRIVFFKTHKLSNINNYLRSVRVDIMLMKQIAGRAGRRGFYDIGYVTTFQERDFEYLKQALQFQLEPIESAGIYPNLEQLKAFSTKFPEFSGDMASILEKYIILSKGHKDFFLCESDTKLQIARKIKHINLTLEQQFTFINAPVPSLAAVMDYLVQYAEDFVNPDIHVVPLHINTKKLIDELKQSQKELEERLSKNVFKVVNGRKIYESISARYGYQDALRQVEFAMKVLDVYRWLSNRYPVRFDQDLVTSVQDTILNHIAKSLLYHTKHNQRHRILTSLPVTEDISTNDNPSTNASKENDDIFSSILDNLCSTQIQKDA